MRLIDADALIELLNKYKFGVVQKEVEREYIKEVILRFVEEQPTAYDVEKVVAELEEQIDKNRGWEDEDYYWGETKGYEHAIEIVRNGGKE